MRSTTYATTQVKPGPQGNAALVLEGAPCGVIGDLSGGGIYKDVVQETVMGPSVIPKKHLGRVHYEDFSLEIGFAMAQPVFDWINATWKRTPNQTRRNGCVRACDPKMEVKSERTFFHALITETTIPTLDASAKDPVWLTLKFASERINMATASGRVSAADPKNPEKILLPSNFKLEIDGLDCTKVARIDAFTIKQTVIRDDVGGPRDPLLEPGKIEFPNLRFTSSEVTEQSWVDYFEDFVLNGHSGDAQEKSGKLKLLSPITQQTLATIHFFNLGICRIGHAPSGAADKVKLATAEMYCERMEFHFGK